MGERHSHPDFQNGRSHDSDRRHHGDISPHLHQNQSLRPSEVRRGLEVPKRRQRATVLELSTDEIKARENYRRALQEIPVEHLYGHQLEEMGICGVCRGVLKHGADGHYHSTREIAAVCCSCAEKMRPGWQCAGSWTKMAHLRGKMSSFAEEAERRVKHYYWQCTVCSHKWRNKNPKKRACSNCGNLKGVRGVARESA